MAPSTNIRSIDMRFIEDIFEMGSGYVLDFSNRTFSEFFEEELGVDINGDKYESEGTSKAKRLRCFLKSCDSSLRIRALSALWEYRETTRRRNGINEKIHEAEAEFYRLIERLGGKRPDKVIPTSNQVQTKVDITISHALRDKLIEIGNINPQKRGYAFERFLKDVFDSCGLIARPSFRLVGEQIDGSFELSGETYLLEAKWQNLPTGATELYAFNGKIENKAT